MIEKQKTTARTITQMGDDLKFPIHTLLEKYGHLRYHPPWILNAYPSYRERWECGEPSYTLAEHIVDELSGYRLHKINAVATDYLEVRLDLKMFMANLRRSNGQWLYQVDVSNKAMKAKEESAILLIAKDYIKNCLRFYYWPANWKSPRGGVGRYVTLQKLSKETPVAGNHIARAEHIIRSSNHKPNPYEYPSLESVIEAVILQSKKAA
jgi:hypothetical protein